MFGHTKIKTQQCLYLFRHIWRDRPQKCFFVAVQSQILRRGGTVQSGGASRGRVCQQCNTLSSFKCNAAWTAKSTKSKSLIYLVVTLDKPFSLLQTQFTHFLLKEIEEKKICPEIFGQKKPVSAPRRPAALQQFSSKMRVQSPVTLVFVLDESKYLAQPWQTYIYRRKAFLEEILHREIFTKIITYVVSF